MSWLSPILLTRDDHGASLSRVTAVAPTAPARTAQPAHVGLGSASAGAAWTWVATSAPSTSEQTLHYNASVVRTARAQPRGASAVRAPIDLLAKMSEAARTQGRSESDVWVEAAREWLRRRDGVETPPSAAPAYVAAPATPAPRMTRVWGEIDAVLQALRAPARTGAERFPAA